MNMFSVLRLTSLLTDCTERKDLGRKSESACQVKDMCLRIFYFGLCLNDQSSSQKYQSSSHLIYGNHSSSLMARRLVGRYPPILSTCTLQRRSKQIERAEGSKSIQMGCLSLSKKGKTSS